MAKDNDLELPTISCSTSNATVYGTNTPYPDWTYIPSSDSAGNRNNIVPLATDRTTMLPRVFESTFENNFIGARIKPDDRYLINKIKNFITEDKDTVSMEDKNVRRLVRVLVVDPDPNLDVNDMFLYKGEEQLTDLDNQELFYTLSMMDLLKKHNEKREKTIDKASTKKSGKDVFLEPIRISNLKMVVIEVARF